MAFLEPDETGRDLVIVDLNETALGILGGREEASAGLRVSDVMDVGPDYLETLPQLIDGSLDGWRVEGPLTFDRSGQVTLQISSLDDSGDEPFFAAQLLDVTAEYDARHGLEAAQTLTNATLDTTNCIIMVTNLEGNVVRANQATSVITGYSEEELLGRKVWETGITPSDADDVEALIMWPNRSGVPIVRESDSITKTGEKLRIVWNTSIVRDEHRRPDVRRHDRHRRHRRAHHGRAGQPPDGGLADHGHRRHRHRGPGLGRQLRYPAPARLRAGRAGRRAVPPAAQGLRAARAHRRGHPRRGLRHPGPRPRPGRRDPRAGLDLDDQDRRRAAGLDDAVRRPGRVRRPERLPLRGPRRHRAAAQPGDADRRARQGAHRCRAAPLARPGQERVRVDGLPRAADTGHEHRRLHRDADRRRRSSSRCPTSCRCSRRSTATASG